MKSNIIFVGLVILLAFFDISQGVSHQKIVEASGNQINNISSFASSSYALVNTSSTLLVATNTARTYLEITNLAAQAIYCKMKGGNTNQVAIMYSGMTILGSSTKAFKIDENPYVGPVYCISQAAASTTILEN